MSINVLARRGWYVLLPALSFVFLASSSPQCTRTSDHLLSPSALQGENSAFGQCVTGCAHAAVEARAEESERFVAAMQACDGDPECHQDEAARHVDRLAVIAHEQRICMAVCHDQGVGSGGN